MNKILITAFLVIFTSYVPRENPANFSEPIPGTEKDISMIFIRDGSIKSKKVKPFYMSAHEVTWDLYKLYLNRSTDQTVNPRISSLKNLDVDGITGASVPYVDMSLGLGTDDGLPVGNVTHIAAARFCKWLSAVTGRFYRLPTALEWEYAARAGTMTPYFFGSNADALDDYAWFDENAQSRYHQVGSKEPNPWGLYDMYGNIAEWTLHDSPNKLNKSKAIKGGSFIHSATQATSEASLQEQKKWKERDPQFPKSKWWFTDAPFVGFRVVSPVDTPPASKFALYWND
jgi:formylglycine-generating enzyme required for sulfatase activity